MIERRTLITGLVALVAAPAIVKAASLMKVAPTEKLRVGCDFGAGDKTAYCEYNPMLDRWTQYPRNDLLTIDQITRESVNLFRNENAFLSELHKQQWTDDFMAANGEQFEMAKVGDVVRIRLPNDYVVSDGPLHVTHPADALAYAIKAQGQLLIEAIPKVYDTSRIPTALGVAALAVAAAPMVEQALQKPVTRRFWGK